MCPGLLCRFNYQAFEGSHADVEVNMVKMQFNIVIGEKNDYVGGG